MRKLLLLCVIFMSLLHAEDFECREYDGDYYVFYRGTRNRASYVSSKAYISKEYCERDLRNILNGKPSSNECECREYDGDYYVFYRGTRNRASYVSSKAYISKEYCERDLRNILNGKSSSDECECREYDGDYYVFYRGTRNRASYVSSKAYISKEYCEEDLVKIRSRR